ncbi:HSP40/DnaJ peptide-binding protein [Chlamydoabsidia padenii]|nr:HSP40/DnaJ peptide-binding protein [Chlamydoabsidia padenii]
MMANGQQQDIEITLEEKPHDTYLRVGDDLFVTVTLGLADALVGFTKEIPALDGTSITLTSDSVIQPGQKVRLNRRGMLNPTTGRKGDLFVTYSIFLPTTLTTDQQLKIVEALGQSSPQ